MSESCFDVENTPTEFLQADMEHLSRIRAKYARGMTEVDRRRRIDIDAEIREIEAELKKRSTVEEK